MFMTYLVPPIVLFLPLAPVLARLGLTDSWWAFAAALPARDRDDGDLRVQPVDAGVSLRGGLRVARGPEGHHGGRLLLGRPDGRGAPRGNPDRRRVLLRPRPFRREPHRRGRRVTRRAGSAASMSCIRCSAECPSKSRGHRGERWRRPNHAAGFRASVVSTSIWTRRCHAWSSLGGRRRQRR